MKELFLKNINKKSPNGSWDIHILLGGKKTINSCFN